MRQLDGTLDRGGVEVLARHHKMEVDAGEDLGVLAGALGLQLDAAAGNVLAAALEDQHHVIGGAAARAEQHHLHRPRCQVVAAALRRAVHRHDMAAAGLGHEAHAVRAHPCHFAFHFVRSCRLYCVLPITNA
ncbi:hypothetical protein D9M72_392930 [compost metagenome]